MNVFTYGSLMFSEVWNKVVEGNYYSSSAVLKHYRRVSIADVTYPGLMPGKASDQVSGIVYHEVSQDDILRLDMFESSFYERQSVNIDVGNCRLKTDVYLMRKQFYHLATNQLWDPDDFYKNNMADFVATYTGF